MQNSIKNSIRLYKESWAILRKDPEIVIFPILNIVAFIPIIIAYFYIFVQFTGGIETEFNEKAILANPMFWISLLPLWITGYFIILFFKAGAITVAIERFVGGDASFKHGFINALKHAGAILIWGIIAASVFWILRILQNKSKYLLSKIFGIVGGITLQFAIYYALPVLLFEQKRGTAILKRSAQLFQKTWGLNVALNVSFGVIGGILGLAIFSLLAVAVLILNASSISKGSLAAWLILSSPVFIGILVGSILSALDGIFRAALYRYAITGEIPSGYSPDLIKNAFAPLTKNDMTPKPVKKSRKLIVPMVVILGLILFVNFLAPIPIIDTIKGMWSDLRAYRSYNEQYLIGEANKYGFDERLKKAMLNCRSLRGVANFNKCMNMLAAEEKRWEICVILRDNVCLAHYAYRNHDKNTCELFNRDWQPAGDIDDKYYNLNLERCKIYYYRDENMCERLVNYPFYPIFFQTFKEECYLAIGVIKKDFSICDKAGRAKDKCYERIKTDETYLKY